MADRGDTDGPVVVSQLIDDAIRPHAQGAEPLQPAAQLVSDVRVAFEQSEGVLDSVDKGPVEVE